jgi:uncharacterized membrane protein
MFRYHLLLWLHILFAITAVGANLTYAFWVARAEREPEHLAFTLRSVQWIDKRVANPAYGMLFLTGLINVFVGGWAGQLKHQVWVALGILGFLVVAGVAGAVYTPALRGQLAALEAGGAGSAEYGAAKARANKIGAAIMVILALIVADMVFKPHV